MKQFLLLMLMMSASSQSANLPYETMDISFEDFMKLANMGNKSPQIRGLINDLEKYDAFITGELRTTFKEMLRIADEEGYRLSMSENIPSFVSIISGCIGHAVDGLRSLDAKYLNADHIEEYALVMTCIGYIDRFEHEIDDLRVFNGEFIDKHDFGSRTYSMWARAVDTKRLLLEETGLFLRHQIPPEENTQEQ